MAAAIIIGGMLGIMVLGAVFDAWMKHHDKND
jgi:cytochrome b subunit of formate dehydrogenase